MLSGSDEKTWVCLEPQQAGPLLRREAGGDCRELWPRRRTLCGVPTPAQRAGVHTGVCFIHLVFSFFFCSKLTGGEVKLKGPLKRPGH